MGSKPPPSIVMLTMVALIEERRENLGSASANEFRTARTADASPPARTNVESTERKENQTSQKPSPGKRKSGEARALQVYFKMLD